MADDKRDGAQSARQVVRICAEVIGQFHHVIKVSFGIITADVKQGELAGMFARDAFEPLKTFKFPVERAFVFESAPPDDLGCPENTGRFTTGQPDFAVGAAVDASQ